MNLNVDELAIFWAKSEREGDSHLSLLQHASDVAGVIETVAERFVSAGGRKRLQKGLGDVPLSTVLRAAAWFHDCGKISSFFQPKDGLLFNRVMKHGYQSSATQKEMRDNPHSIISAYAVAEWFYQRPDVKPDRKAIRGWKYVIGGHHGVFPESGKSSAVELEPENWKQARFRFLDYGMELLGIEDEEVHALATLPWGPPEQALVNGILIAADWVGSNELYFPYVPEEPDLRLERALSRLDLGGAWHPTEQVSSDFATRFSLPVGAQMRSVQRAAISVATEQSDPFFMLVENVTGGGKTELALTVAEIAAHRFGFDGLFFGQPTRVTSDAMLSRVLGWLETGANSDDVISTILAHGKAEFNEDYQALKDVQLTEIYDADYGQSGPVLEATKWFRGRKTGLLASVVVGTIDQLLFAALKSKHVTLRHLGLANKVVIIDEVHAADDYMREYLTRILEWLGCYEVPVIALSATLPAQQRNDLVTAYRRGANHSASEALVVPDDEGYPRITVATAGDVATVYPEPDERRKETRVEFLDGALEELAQAVTADIQDGGCVAVICSTVSRAQEMYNLLVDIDPDAEVELLHSRFIAEHRLEKESALVEQLGKKQQARPEKIIVVSTQIIEQGLDLDFDLIFSDIAPLDLLIQRMGRLHRHEHLNELRPRNMREARMVIVGAGIPDESASAPTFPRGIIAVYRRAPLLRSTLALIRHLKRNDGVVVSPDHIAGLVEAAYSQQLISPETWQKTWDDADEKDRQFRTGQCERAQDYRLPDPKEKSLEKWSTILSPAEEVKGVAQVRDADESIEVIVVMRREDRIFALPSVEKLEGISLDGILPIDWEVGRALARCSVRLPFWVVSDAVLDELEKHGQESWQKNPWLAGQIPLVLDENLENTVGGFLLSYNEEYGLLIERMNDKKEGQQ